MGERAAVEQLGVVRVLRDGVAEGIAPCPRRPLREMAANARAGFARALARGSAGGVGLAKGPRGGPARAG